MPSPWSRSVRLSIAASLVLLVGLVCWAPLWVYAISLACFGLAHVVYETRYVDGRFGRRIPWWTIYALLGLCIALVSARALFITHVWPHALQAPVELALLVAFTVLAVPLLWRQSSGLAIIGVAVVASIATGSLLAPVATLTAFSILHNITPVGFLAEAAPPARRRAVMAWAGLVMIGVPIVVATGLPQWLLGMGPVELVNEGPFAMASLPAQLPVYVPPGIDPSFARPLFCAAVVAQVLHYVATIGLFPRVATRNRDDGHRVPWPRSARLLAVVTVASAVLLVGFFISFSDARALYGLPAAVHAWLELPLLLVGLTALPKGAPGSPAR